MRELEHIPTHVLIAEVILRLNASPHKSGVDIVTVNALRRLRNQVVAELDRRYPHLLNG